VVKWPGRCVGITSLLEFARQSYLKLGPLLLQGVAALGRPILVQILGKVVTGVQAAGLLEEGQRVG